MHKHHDIQSIRAELRKTEPAPDSQGDKKTNMIITSILGIALAVAVSASIPFVTSKIETASIEPVKGSVEAPTETTTETAALKEHEEAYIWTARLKLQELMLNHRLDIEKTDTNALEIKGAIAPDEKAQWNAFLKWYDTKETFPELNHQVTATAVSGQIPDLKSVWFGSNPTAYFQDGSFGSVGAYIQDGWKVVGIEPWAVFVERDEVVITLGYE